MVRRLLTLALLVGSVICGAVLVEKLRGYRLPGDQQGYEPQQPIAFSHRQHAGDLQIACEFCHSGAESSRHAGIPSSGVCMNCHRFVTAPQKDMVAEILAARQENRAPRPVVSPELQKLYDSLGLNEKLERDPDKTPEPIRWVKVHNLPDYACFDHRAHTNAGVTCQRCHGPVETMDRVRQESDLSMGWCVNCHRECQRNGVNGKPAQPSIDCATCHH